MANIRLFDPAPLSLSDPFDSLFRGFMMPMRMDRTLDDMDIRIDVVEKEKSFKVRADLPGFKKEDINVRIDGNIVQIDASTKTEKETKDEGGKVLRNERYCGSVSRTFSLSQDVDDAGANAKFEDGVLSLELPKKASTESKRLTIS